MKKLGLHELRKEFLDFFEEKKHLIVPSYSLIPENDASLLLIGAGMAPLKKYFTQEEKPPSKRMATCQKCIRTGDIENVGKTDRHATFFEMLGNFSFGDYFKLEAMEWALEFLVDRLEIPIEDIWVSVYEKDEEAYKLWRDNVGLSEDKIIRLGKDDNFWELEVGPSGPSSEIFVDRGKKYGCQKSTCKPGCDCDRFIEVWNLVFTQFDKDEEGNYHRLSNPNIDTGMGLERLTAVLEEADNIFEIAAIQDIIKYISSLCNYKYGSDDKKDESIRVITDHTRAMTFLVSDGVLPSNEGRGYVLRRIIRRASRHGKLLNINGKFLADIVNLIIDSWKVEYKDLEKNRDRIIKIIETEEEKFQETIDGGIDRLNNYINKLKSENENVLSGDLVFKLYDTYGFPIDLTKEILEENGLDLDEKGFKNNMEKQRERARKARKTDNVGWNSDVDKKIFDKYNTEFKGYDTLKTSSKIISLLKDGTEVEELSDKGLLILNKTPFYGESGGQVGDKGIIEGDNFKAEVIDTQIISEKIVHTVEVKSGVLKLGDEVSAIVFGSRRGDIKRNHTATHLLHKALKKVLGSHVNQSGSIVLPDRLRFDFTHFESMTEKEILQVEEEVNKMILSNLDINIIETTLEEAEKLGAVGLFEDKYKDIVRVIEIDDYSIELCGGTHVDNTSEIGLFKIISESGIASGVRRIEAITGKEVYRYMLELDGMISNISKELNSDKENLMNKIKDLKSDIDLKEEKIKELRKELIEDEIDNILDSVNKIDDINYIVYRLKNIDMDSMRNLSDRIKNSIDSGVIVLSSVNNSKLSFLCVVTNDLIQEKGLKAGNIIREVAKITEGGGGGRPNIAQAGGKNIAKLELAMSKVPDIIKSQLK